MKKTLSEIGLVRVGVCAPELRVADVEFNTQMIVKAIDDAVLKECYFLLFPELCITGYTCADLFFQSSLLKAVLKSLETIAEHTAKTHSTVIVGAPIADGGKIFNCAVFISDGKILGMIPKTYLPNYAEFYEERWFSSSRETTVKEIVFKNEKIPFGTDILFKNEVLKDCIVGIEICEDLWALEPMSSNQAAAGATLLLNLSASDEILGKAWYRRTLVQSQSGRCLAAYAYASAGAGESTTDLVFSGHSLIAENGAIMAETERFSFETQIAYADIDVEKLVHDRFKNTSYAYVQHGNQFREILFKTPETSAEELFRNIPQSPFVPANDAERAERCREVFAIQVTGLAKRLKHINSKAVTIGLSGGLDSTLAMLVIVKAFDLLKLDRKGIYAITMPGFGTTERTKSNADILARELGVTFKTIPIHDAVVQHFKDIEHDASVHDVTYENSQARERTQILMDYANKVGGIVIGTGDLSEMALGWSTYNGDHMSMYSVNSGIPKTLVKYVVKWSAEEEFTGEVSKALLDIFETPVSPELLPPDKEGKIAQKTEESIGPYVLHDFFLYHFVRLNYTPLKIFHFAKNAFKGTYSDAEIVQWLEVFFKRFFSQQFKRSCIPDGVKVGSVALSPRGDWRMPSDARADVWLKEIELLKH
jgi:NAD+ synthase (glutamine-hydrolysing)